MSITTRPGDTFAATLTGAPNALGTTLTAGIRSLPDGVMVSAASASGIVETDVGATSNYVATRTAPTDVSLSYEVVWLVSGVENSTEDLHVEGILPGLPGAPYFTVAEARALAPLGDAAGYPDAAIEDARDTAEQALEEACGVAFVPRDVTETLDGSGTSRLVFSKLKVTAISAVTVGTTSPVAYTSDQLAAVQPRASGVIYNSNRWPYGVGNISVTYTHGWPTPPPEVKRAALILTRYYLVDSPYDDRATAISTEDGTFSVTVWPREVQAVIARYRAPTVG